MSNSIHKEVDLKANQQRVYEALLDAKQFSSFSGRAADIQPEAGGALSCFDGMITGRNVELVTNRRIVQVWRVKLWPEGLYSIVTFELYPNGQGTRLTLNHVGFPEEM